MNDMVEEIRCLPEMWQGIWLASDEAVRDLAIDGARQLSTDRIYLVGCGDGYSTALGLEFAVERFTGLPTEAMTSLEFARYAAERLPSSRPNRALVIGVSVSGETARTVEAIEAGKENGADSLAVTSRRESRLARAAESTLQIILPALPKRSEVPTPGMRSCLVSQMALLLWGLQVGEVRGVLSATEAETLRFELRDLGEKCSQTIERCEGIAHELAQEWSDARAFTIAGSGPNRGTALFTACKFVEACGDLALAVDTEEWRHTYYFARDASAALLVLTTGGRDLNCAVEVARLARSIGGRIVVVAPPGAKELMEVAGRCLPVADGTREEFSPLLLGLPGTLLAAFRSDVLGETFYRGIAGGRDMRDGGTHKENGEC